MQSIANRSLYVCILGTISTMLIFDHILPLDPSCQLVTQSAWKRGFIRLPWFACVICLFVPFLLWTPIVKFQVSQMPIPSIGTQVIGLPPLVLPMPQAQQEEISVTRYTYGVKWSTQLLEQNILPFNYQGKVLFPKYSRLQTVSAKII